KAKARVEAFDGVSERAHVRRQDGQVKICVGAARMGRKIIEAKNLCKAYGGVAYIDKFSYEFVRGEKVGIIGKNGAGKTTLLNLLAGTVPPDSGHVQRGETVEMGYYRQEGMDVNPEKRVIDVARDVAEYITMGDGQHLSAAQFLNHFLFPPSMQQNLVRKLSGGERRRLYLLTILMRQPNFLVLDEPTNDLDLMTLAVLEDYLRTFEGCLLIVSHDRYFMDKIVDHLFVFEEVGRLKDFPGTYTDYRDYRQRQPRRAAASTEKAPAPPRRGEAPPRKPTFAQRREHEALPADIASLEQEKADIERQLSAGALGHDALARQAQRMAALLVEIEEKELRWLELDELLSTANP
ncbi:MAG: ATP-binding cassette domain-containing protein, partial [Prevotellaceae bacterium]|nr:ATP-binding cassette domain-containing protein [Prevotellaceae bacterium]